PRWYTQSYVVFLALRQHPYHCMPRGDLINAALELDLKISQERNIPRAFRGKTPQNSCSHVLTCNSERYFISFKPEGSRKTFFKLAYQPGSFDSAFKEYEIWMTRLIDLDWPHCFGRPFPASLEKRAALEQKHLKNSMTASSSTTVPSPTDNKENDTPNADDTAPNKSYNPESPSPVLPARHDLSTLPRPLDSVDEKEKTDNGMTIPSHHNRDKPRRKQPNPYLNYIEYTLDELDTSDIPKSLDDILYAAKSGIQGAGEGLFAKRDLPGNSPLGFYFGVPMTEDEFDSIKDNIGRSSEYSIRYRKTILDATDAEGQPWTDPNNTSTRLCPFHYMNEAHDTNSANVLFVEGFVVNQVICWSKWPIRKGDELLVWYGDDVARHW
ncbi:hypothetical protein DM01DRAFT_237911, partial [Hesseltinella vesiculosa]